MRQYLVSDLLHEGAENGTTLAELVQLTGEDERSIRRRIQAERKAGKLIWPTAKMGIFCRQARLIFSALSVRCRDDQGRSRRSHTQRRCAFKDDRSGDLAGVAKWLNEGCSQSQLSTRRVS